MAPSSCTRYPEELRRLEIRRYNARRTDCIIQGRYAGRNHSLHGFKRTFYSLLAAEDVEEYYVPPPERIHLSYREQSVDYAERNSKRQRVAAIANAYTNGKNVPTILTASLTLGTNLEENPWDERWASGYTLSATEVSAKLRCLREDLATERSGKRRQRRAERRARIEKATQLQTDGLGRSDEFPVDLTVDITVSGLDAHTKAFPIRLSQTSPPATKQQTPQPMAKSIASEEDGDSKQEPTSSVDDNHTTATGLAVDRAAKQPNNIHPDSPPISASNALEAGSESGRRIPQRAAHTRINVKDTTACVSTPWFRRTASTLAPSNLTRGGMSDAVQTKRKTRVCVEGPQPVKSDTPSRKDRSLKGSFSNEMVCKNGTATPEHRAMSVEDRPESHGHVAVGSQNMALSAIKKGEIPLNQDTNTTTVCTNLSDVQNAQDARFVQISNGDFSTQAAMEEVHGAFQDAFQSPGPDHRQALRHGAQTPTRDIPDVVETVTPFKDFHLRSTSSFHLGDPSHARSRIPLDTQALLAATSPFVRGYTPEKVSEQLDGVYHSTLGSPLRCTPIISHDRIPPEPTRAILRNPKSGSHEDSCNTSQKVTLKSPNAAASFATLCTPKTSLQEREQETPWSLQSANRQARTMLSYEAGQRLLDASVVNTSEAFDFMDEMLDSWDVHESPSASKSSAARNI
ncbi:hypothetical protein EJ05DRAFT_496563 [Pseudovirgaria hyperparasitica]|uniref:Uncharacterized protein n=1 Tax=Pseudovirgaria hyperparasitica TaxID=470096 RepID=A0A6A6WJS6_9PEZI|nr:uncharacterized protein EJ05DRAFT_496563 [Pseudovirgaria hyperparasitica]KAF2761661.1 hypothetical protein EJ05DRAFT_496563 [Pseudovirgaria hyperparasitica]